MALVLWTTADTPLIKKVIGPVVQRQGVPHRVEDVKTTLPPTAEGDVVLAFGSKAVDLIKAGGHVAKNLTVGSLREKPLAIGGAKFLVTYDPYLTEKDYARLPEVQWDIMLASRLVRTGGVAPVLGEYRYVDDLSDLIKRIDELYEEGKPVAVACDTETIGLDEYAPGVRIVSMMFSVDEGKSDILYFEEGEAPAPPANPLADMDELSYWEALWVQINWVLTTKKVKTVGANFKFDSRWTNYHWQINCTNQGFDTTLVGSLLDENRSNSLKLHVKLYTDLGGYDSVLGGVDMGRMDLVPKDKFAVYAGGDSDGTRRIYTPMRKELFNDKALTNFYVKILHPSAKVFEKMERNGLLVDVPYMKALQQELVEDKKRLAHEMLDCVPWKLRHKYKDTIAQQLDDEKSPFLPKFLKEFLFSPAGLNLKPVMFTPQPDSEGKPNPSTSKHHLLRLAEDEDAAPFIKLFSEYNSTSKTEGTYVTGFLKHLRPDCRFHANYMLFRGDYGSNDDDSGTNSGRSSAKDPAVQTIPKRTKWTKKLRKAYIAPPGKVILQLDFSQGELKITACLAEETTMINAYKGGIDLHSLTASTLMGLELEEFMALEEELREYKRSGGKAGNFGLIYGMQAPGFKEYARNSYGVILTSEEALDFREKFFARYYRLPEWHEEYALLAHKQGFVRSPLGRVRHLPLIHSKDWSVKSLAERQAINAPVQSTLSDMMQLAMILIDREYPEVEMCLMCHDSIAAYVPEDEAVMWAKRLKDILENLPLHEFGWKPQLQFTADAEFGATLADLKKIKQW